MRINYSQKIQATIEQILLIIFRGHTGKNKGKRGGWGEWGGGGGEKFFVIYIMTHKDILSTITKQTTPPASTLHWPCHMGTGGYGLIYQFIYIFSQFKLDCSIGIIYIYYLKFYSQRFYYTL